MFNSISAKQIALYTQDYEFYQQRKTSVQQ